MCERLLSHVSVSRAQQHFSIHKENSRCLCVVASANRQIALFGSAKYFHIHIHVQAHILGISTFSKCILGKLFGLYFHSVLTKCVFKSENQGYDLS